MPLPQPGYFEPVEPVAAEGEDHQAWELTRFPDDPVPCRFAESVCRKLFNEAPLPPAPTELSRFW